MMRHALPLTYLALAILFMSSCGKGDEETAGGMPGFREPAEIMKNATFIDLEGDEVTLEDYAGKFVVVDFWETWCGPCLQVFPAMQQLTEEFPGEFQMLAVTVGMTDSIEDARTFRDERDYTFAFLFDQNDIFERFEIGSIPFKVYIGPDGEVIKAELGSRGRQGDYNTAKKLFLEATGRSSADPS
jgi:thiol-disulfide isomerase/thioredoxin